MDSVSTDAFQGVHASRRLIGVLAAVVLLGGAQVSRAESAGSWDSTGAMALGRSGHTLTLLNGPACKTSPRPSYCGKVLVAGGTTNSTDPADPYSFPATASSELYDPQTGGWAPTGSLNTARSAHTATLLADGKVLVIGGRGDGPYGGGLTSAELYDPTTGIWSSCSTTGTPSASCPGAMTGVNGRYDHTATRLQDGRVLVVGGADAFTSPDEFASDPTAELYDPATGTFSKTGELMQPRYQQSATLLHSGKVLVTGGTFPPGRGGPLPGHGPENDEVKLSSELYDPATGTWNSCSFFKPPASIKPTSPDCPGDLNEARAAHSATLLPDGKVLVAGGGTDNVVRKSAELYDPATGAWSLTKQLNIGREGQGAALLPNGTVLVAGGEGAGFNSGLGSAELFDPTTAGTRWILAAFMVDARGSNFLQPRSVPAVLLSSDADTYKADSNICGANCGKVLVAGGLDETLNARLASAELYTPAVPATTPPEPSPGLTPGPLPGPAPGPGPVPAAPGSARDITRPLISALRVFPARFMIGSLLPRLAHVARVGTTIRFTLSERAAIRLAFARRHFGRRVGRSCRPATRTLRHRPLCTRYLPVYPSVRFARVRAGANRVRFEGRLSRTRTLRPGRYRLTAIAIDAAGNRSKPKRAVLTATRH